MPTTRKPSAPRDLSDLDALDAPPTGRAQLDLSAGPRDPWEHLDAWERQPGETPAQHRNFVAYRDLGPTRTLAQAAEALDRGHAYMRKLSYQLRWVERATAWDAEVERQHQVGMSSQRRELAERHLTVAGRMLEIGIAKLEALATTKMGVRETVLFIDTAVKIQRLALGDTTANVKLTGDGSGAGVSSDAFMALSAEEQAQRLAEIQREIQRRRALVDPSGEAARAAYDSPEATDVPVLDDDEPAGRHSRQDPEPRAAGRR